MIVFASSDFTDSPRPGWRLWAISGMAILSCLLVAGGGVALLLLPTGVCGLLGGLTLLVAPLWFVRLEYIALTRPSMSASYTSFFVWQFVTSLIGIALIGGRILAWQHRAPMSSWIDVQLLTLFAIGMLGVWLHRRWIDSLRAANIGLADEPTSRSSARELLLSVAAAAVVLSASRLWIEAQAILRGEHQTAEQVPFSVPPGASDISYCRVGWQGLAYEFTIEEETFRHWAKAHGVHELGRIPSATIWRYTAFDPTRTFYDRNITLDDCLLGSTNSVVGDGVHLAYSRRTKRAYYFWSASRPY